MNEISRLFKTTVSQQKSINELKLKASTFAKIVSDPPSHSPATPVEIQNIHVPIPVCTSKHSNDTAIYSLQTGDQTSISKLTGTFTSVADDTLGTNLNENKFVNEKRLQYHGQQVPAFTSIRDAITSAQKDEIANLIESTIGIKNSKNENVIIIQIPSTNVLM